MAKQMKLKANLRTESGKSLVKRLRASGVVPAVIYGPHTQPVSVGVGATELEDLLHHASSENVLVDLQIEEAGQTKNRLALIQEVQHHPVTDAVLHVDFHELSATEKFRTVVPVRALGEPEGVKTGGGVLEYVMRELHVECLPKDLPDMVEVNVEALQIGQSIHVRDVKPPAGVTFLDDADQPVFIVVAPVVEEEAPAEGAELAEPEVIGAKKEEGEEGAEAEGKKGEAKPAAAAGKAEAGKPAAGAKAEAKPAAGKAAAPAKPAGGGKPEAKK